MPRHDDEAEIAAYIRTNGVTRCPTACAAPTRASGCAADRATLRRRAEQREAAREEKLRQLWRRADAPHSALPRRSIGIGLPIAGALDCDSAGAVLSRGP